MDERFICRNRHRWRLSLEGRMLMNPRWIACPACGAPPVPAQPLPWRQRLSTWLHRNPQLGLLGSIIILLATAAILTISLWKEREVLRSARNDATSGERR
jgi:hypothetical protein